MRHVSWFSCGAASAVATKLAIAQHPGTIVVRCIVENEDPDNDRFANDCAEWFNRPVLELRSAKYKDCWQVWEERRFLNGPAGALCTVEMKKKVRQRFQQPGDIQYFGFTIEEVTRSERFIENNLEVDARFPLIESVITKQDCFKKIQAQGIELPRMYQLGYNNANCIGCVKGGMGYWNKVRVTHPEVFNRMALLERDIGHSCIKGVFLDELDPERGRHEDVTLPECGLFCYDGVEEVREEEVE